ncbi:hypothetical protein LZ32DRAFT_588614 [Colletotrichum eremochloae]|nr:hypothetical protein LZ32DRAFT_588614 [Colletotrichum eremochloae]
MNYRVDPDTIHNILQLAAKLHELLVVASLSSIALAMFRRRLVTNGVRLGFLTGGYRVGDLGYMGTKAFWRQGLDISNPWDMLLPGFVVFATIMSTIVGPASAVLLVPSLGWYEIDNSMAFDNITLPLRYSWNRTDIWYAGRHGAPKECKTVMGIYNDYCPAGGFPQISSWLRDYAATNLMNNLTFLSTSADLRRHLVFTQVNDTQNITSTTLCTTPVHFLTTSIGLFQKYIHDVNVGALSNEPRYRLQTNEVNPDNPSQLENSTLYQPFVQSKCTVHDKEELNNDPNPVFYPVDSFNCFQDDECLRFKNGTKEFSEGWLKNPKYEGRNTSSSTNFFVSNQSSSIVLIHGQIPDASSGEQKDMVYLCSLVASWAPSNFSVDAKFSDVLQSSLNNENAMQELYRNNQAHNVHTFRFSSRWFETLSPRWNITNTTGTSAMGEILRTFSSMEKQNGATRPVIAPFSWENKTAAELFLSKVFGVYLTEGLARGNFKYEDTRILRTKSSHELTYINLNEQHGFRGGEHKWTVFNSTTSRETWRKNDTYVNRTLQNITTSLQNGLPIYIVAERHGYGSGQQRRTLHWAQAMMYIYLGTVAIYALVVGVMSILESLKYERGGMRVRVLSIIPWSDLQDLMILALKTPVPNDRDLADAGAGVTCSRVWEKTVRARADDECNAQLVLEETRNTRELDLDGRERYY